MTPFGAILRQWREARRRSQSELAGLADVSPRHVSFLESGRSSPSRDMVLRLAEALDVPLRAQDELLESAGFRATWRARDAAREIDPLLERVLSSMMRKHDPYPLVIFDCHLDVMRVNDGATRLMAAFLGPAVPPPPWNLLDLVFDDRLLKPVLDDWERVAHTTLALARRELHQRPNDEALGLRLRALARSGFTVSPAADPPAAFAIRLRRGDLQAAFVTTLTVFSAPASVAADELRIESYFPLDDATESLCRRLAGPAIG